MLFRSRAAHCLDTAEWMQRKGFGSVEAMRGTMSREQLPATEAFERVNYIQVLENYRARWG